MRLACCLGPVVVFFLQASCQTAEEREDASASGISTASIPITCGRFLSYRFATLETDDYGGACQSPTSNACADHGPATTSAGLAECEHCCSDMSCGQLAARARLIGARCEVNGNGACAGRGIPTVDCDACCGVADPAGTFQLPYPSGTPQVPATWDFQGFPGPKLYHDREWPNVLGYDFVTNAAGVPLVAPMTGTVNRVAVDGIGNPYIEIVDDLPSGGRLSILLMHGDYAVAPGVRVYRGETPIGWEASHGASSNPHTHMSVRVDGVAIDFLGLGAVVPSGPTGLFRLR